MQNGWDTFLHEQIVLDQEWVCVKQMRHSGIANLQTAFFETESQQKSYYVWEGAGGTLICGQILMSGL